MPNSCFSVIVVFSVLSYSHTLLATGTSSLQFLAFFFSVNHLLHKLSLLRLIKMNISIFKFTLHEASCSALQAIYFCSFVGLFLRLSVP